ncbi:MAG: 30S ribosomal protein S8 [Alphaproteobacteria bacterium CG_4_10_14_0_2_um_filter_63_37]|nr:MAG: 30S ribosomal protein S8 [Proteobacteria bacterium CG1_02_64_396]PJA25566.1 MAG: 30S ribosomal protein S8 [Alphaproteobacteria bacterium CG_4_10_14_0_2_um_filter_63_37]
MAMTDPIADMLTRIRNGQTARLDVIRMPASKMKTAIASILKDEGYIRAYKVGGEGAKRTLSIQLKYTPEGNGIEHISRLSKPGLRRYVAVSEIPFVRNGFGIAILSTSRGVVSDRQAREFGVGGEILCQIW